MRHLARTLLVLAAACGGGDPASPPPPPPPPPPPQGVATSMAIQAGDGQTAAAGTPVAVAPAVLVRDQNGQPMSGVAVSFAIDSGGGSLSSSSATTGSNGIASSGAWTLGLGRNKLRATSGSLSPVIFVATATGELPLSESTIGTGGGELRVTRPGSPFDGLVVRVPNGAFGETVTITAKYGDTTGIPAVAGFRLLGPPVTLGVTGTGLVTGRPLELEFTGTLAPGEVPVVMLFDRATGAREALLTAKLAGNRVVALTQHLDAGRLVTPGAAPSIGRVAAASAVPFPVQAVLGVVTEEQLAGDLDTGFRPGVDDWELDHALLSISPPFRHAPGLPMAAAWYFENRRGAGALNKKFQRAAGVEWSNPMGFRMALEASELVNLGPIALFNNSLAGIAALVASSGVTRDSLLLLYTKAQLLITERPQILFAVDPDKPSVTPLALLVHRTQGSAMQTTTGTSQSGTNAPRSIALAGGKFPVPSWIAKDPLDEPANNVSQQPTTLWAGGQNTGVAPGAMRQLWDRFDAGTLGDEYFPKIEVATSDGDIVTETLFVRDDTTWVWAQCATCPHGNAPGPRVTPAGRVQSALIYTESNGVWTKLAGAMKGNGVRTTEDDADRLIGLALAEVNGGGGAAYNNWKQFRVKLRRLVVTPSPLEGAGGTNHTLTATYDQPLPPNPTWKWELGDNRVLETQTNTLQVQYPAPSGSQPDTFKVKVSLRAGNKLEATGRTLAVITPGNRWQLTSFTRGDLTNNLKPGSNVPVTAWEDTPTMTENELRDSLLARPAGGIIQFYAANAPRPQAWRHPGDINKLGWVGLSPSANTETVFVTFPRGAQTMAGLVAGTGNAIITPGQVWPVNYNQPDFANQLVKTTSPSGFSGRGASMAYGTQTNFPAPSEVMRYFEISATATPTGLTGTITAVRRVQCWENFQAWGCSVAVVGEVRRVYHFTAVPK